MSGAASNRPIRTTSPVVGACTIWRFPRQIATWPGPSEPQLPNSRSPGLASSSGTSTPTFHWVSVQNRREPLRQLTDLRDARPGPVLVVVGPSGHSPNWRTAPIPALYPARVRSRVSPDTSPSAFHSPIWLYIRSRRNTALRERARRLPPVRRLLHTSLDSTWRSFTGRQDLSGAVVPSGVKGGRLERTCRSSLFPQLVTYLTSHLRK